MLRKLAHEQVGALPGKGCYWDGHELEHAESGAHISGKDWEWADLDGKRLVWAERAQAMSARSKSALIVWQLSHPQHDGTV